MIELTAKVKAAMTRIDNKEAEGLPLTEYEQYVKNELDAEDALPANPVIPATFSIPTREAEKYGITELLYADMAYRLASMLLPKDMVPTLTDMREGMNMIPGFGTYFGPGIVNEITGDVTWPTGKQGVIEAYYNTLEEQTTNLLSVKDTVIPEFMQDAAMAVYAEREGRGVAYPDAPHGEAGDYAAIAGELASKAFYIGSRAIKLLRENNRLSFNTRSNMTIADLDNLQNCELNQVDSDDGYIGDPMETPDNANDGWGTFFAPDHTRDQDIFDLQPVEYEAVIPWKKAFDAWYAWIDFVPGARDALIDEIEFQKERAQEFRDSQRKNSPVKGKKRAA